MIKTLVALFVMVLFYLSCSASHAAEVAIIVNRENTTDNISYKNLVKIFKQEKQYWGDGKKIYLVMQKAGSSEKGIVLKKIYKMDDKELKKFWLAKIFREEISSFPNTLSSNEAVKRFISQVPNAIGFIDASFLDENVKTLSIDGKLPDDKEYMLEE